MEFNSGLLLPLLLLLWPTDLRVAPIYKIILLASFLMAPDWEVQEYLLKPRIWKGRLYPGRELQSCVFDLHGYDRGRIHRLGSSCLGPRLLHPGGDASMHKLSYFEGHRSIWEKGLWVTYLGRCLLLLTRNTWGGTLSSDFHPGRCILTLLGLQTCTRGGILLPKCCWHVQIPLSLHLLLHKTCTAS